MRCWLEVVTGGRPPDLSILLPAAPWRPVNLSGSSCASQFEAFRLSTHPCAAPCFGFPGAACPAAHPSIRMVLVGGGRSGAGRPISRSCCPPLPGDSENIRDPGAGRANPSGVSRATTHIAAGQRRFEASDPRRHGCGAGAALVLGGGASAHLD